MGVSSGSSNQSGFSQGKSSYQSSPVNLQYPDYQNLAPGVASGLLNFATSDNFTNPTGVADTNPYQVYNPNTGLFVNSNDTAQNSLVAGIQPSEWTGLSRANALATGAAGPNAGNGAVGTGIGTAGMGVPTLARMLSPNYPASLATSPQTRAAVQSAINPLQASFQQNTMPSLKGQFTGAGQRIGTGKGSSAFDEASVNAENSLLSQEGAVAGGITNAAYQTGLNQQAGAVGEAGSIGQTQAGLGTQELSNVLTNLQAQALPRLVQQYGINQGLQLYQTQVQSLLQSLGLAGQVSQPAIAYNSTGSGQSIGNSSGSSKNGGFNLGVPLV